MRFTALIDAYLRDMRAQSRITSARTEIAYRQALEVLADAVDNRDPRLVGREDVKRTLQRWSHPNTQMKRRSMFVSFFGWMEEEGLRETNPARQTPRARRRQSMVYRLTRSETVAMLNACQTTRERRAIYLGICAGLRSAELRGLQGRHFRREGYVWVSPDIGKGGRQRWVPVLAELRDVVLEIREHVGSDEYVLPAQRWRDPGINRSKADKAKHPSSAQALYYLVKRVGKRAGVAAEVHPHLMRHAFGDFLARNLGIEVARALLGHATLETTKTYVGEPSLDELANAVSGFTFNPVSLSPVREAATAGEAPTGIEPVVGLLRGLEPKVAIYVEHFRALGASA